MRVAVKAVTNRVQLRTIITYDFMLYGSRRFQGAGSVGQLPQPLQPLQPKPGSQLLLTRRDLREAYSVLLHQMTMLENQRAPGPGGNLRHVARTPLKFARNGVFCLRRQYTHEYTFPFWVV
jgi:hypothetical protein